MGYNFKKLNEVNVAEEISEAAHVLVEDNGEIKRAPKSMVGGSGGGSAAMHVYDRDTLDVETVVAFAKEFKRFAFYDSNYWSGSRKRIFVSFEYQMRMTDASCSCSGVSEYYLDLPDVYSCQITEEQYNEILAAWEAMVGTNV